MNQISEQSDWSASQINEFLTGTVIPVRLAVMDDGFPLICSVWFDVEPDTGDLVCAVHRDSRLARLLKETQRCGFEIAPSEPPYHGVRGKGEVSLDPEPAEATLRRLIRRYLGDTNSSLAAWLLSRVDGELEVRIHPVWVTAWDYRDRMDPA